MIDAALEYGQKQRADRDAGQSSLFGQAAGEVAGTCPAPTVPETSGVGRADPPEPVRRRRSASTSAATRSRATRELLEDFATHGTASGRERDAGQRGGGGGIVGELKRRRSKKGEWWASLQLEDTEGQVDVLVFPKCYEANQTEIELVTDRDDDQSGRIDVDEERVRLIADAILPLDELRERQADAVQVCPRCAGPGRGTRRSVAACRRGAPRQRPAHVSRGRSPGCLPDGRPGGVGAQGQRPRLGSCERWSPWSGPDRVRCRSKGRRIETNAGPPTLNRAPSRC